MSSNRRAAARRDTRSRLKDRKTSRTAAAFTREQEAAMALLPGLELMRLRLGPESPIYQRRLDQVCKEFNRVGLRVTEDDTIVRVR